MPQNKFDKEFEDFYKKNYKTLMKNFNKTERNGQSSHANGWKKLIALK